MPKPKIRPCSYLVNHDLSLNFPLSLHDQTHTNKCLDNLFVGHKSVPELKTRISSYISFQNHSLVRLVQVDVFILFCLSWRIALSLYQLNLGKSCLIILLNLMPLVSSYLSKAYQLNLMIVFPLYLIRY